MGEQRNLEKVLALKEKTFSDSIARTRLESFFDADTFVEIGGFMNSEREPVELVCGYGLVSGMPLYGFSQGGAIGEKHSYKMKKVYELALKTGTPLVGFYDSKGLHLSQGVSVLDSQGELILHQNNLSGVVPQIAVIVGDCIGSNAVLACSADYLIMSKDGIFYSTPPTSYTNDDISNYESVSQAGVAHIVAEDEQGAIEAARQLISMHPLNFESPAPLMEFGEEELQTELLRELSEQTENLNADEILEGIFDKENNIPLLTDFGTGVNASLRTLNGIVCGVLFTNGGNLTADDCAKIARLVSVWDSFDMPVITFVNTTGLAELGAASARDFAKVAHVLAEATTVKISVIIGKAYGAGYIALASRASNSDYTVAWPSALISTLPPQTAVAFLEGGRITTARSRESLEEEYIEQRASALNAAQEGIIDDVIDPADTRMLLTNKLEILSSKHVEKRFKKHSNIPF